MIKTSAQEVEIVTHSRFVGDLFTDDPHSIILHERLEDARPADPAVITLGETADFRRKLADALDCAEGLGI